MSDTSVGSSNKTIILVIIVLILILGAYWYTQKDSGLNQSKKFYGTVAGADSGQNKLTLRGNSVSSTDPSSRDLVIDVSNTTITRRIVNITESAKNQLTEEGTIEQTGSVNVSDLMLDVEKYNPVVTVTYSGDHASSLEYSITRYLPF